MYFTKKLHLERSPDSPGRSTILKQLLKRFSVIDTSPSPLSPHIMLGRGKEISESVRMAEVNQQLLHQKAFLSVPCLHELWRLDFDLSAAIKFSKGNPQKDNFHKLIFVLTKIVFYILWIKIICSSASWNLRTQGIPCGNMTRYRPMASLLETFLTDSVEMMEGILSPFSQCREIRIWDGYKLVNTLFGEPSNQSQTP